MFEPNHKISQASLASTAAEAGNWREKTLLDEKKSTWEESRWTERSRNKIAQFIQLKVSREYIVRRSISDTSTFIHIAKQHPTGFSASVQPARVARQQKL